MTQNALKKIAGAASLLTLVLACLTPAGAQTFTGVFTQHNDNSRTGQNLGETILTPANVNIKTFGKVFSYPVDGQIYSQPLYVPNVSVPGQGIHNVVYVATQNDSLYAFDADGLSSKALWQVSFVNPAAGITPVTCTSSHTPNVYCSVYPVAGILSTPVIDPTSGTIYLVARTDNNGAFFQTLHAIDITTGAEKFGGPVNITGSVPGTGQNSKNGVITFPTNVAIQRSGLLLANGRIYIAWAAVQHGWIMAYDAQTLQQKAILNTTPNSIGGGVWASGNGLVADASGYIYAAVADGGFDANTAGTDYGDTILKLDASLNLVDYFTPLDQDCRAHNDMDLGSGGPMLLPTQPGNVPNELLIAGKGGTPCDLNPADSPIYLLNQDSLGQYNVTQDQDVEEVAGAPGGYWSSPAYWQGASGTYVYYGGVVAEAGDGDYLKTYSVTNGMLSTAPVAQSTNLFPVGATPSISANGTSNGIVWAIDRPDALGVLPGKQAAVLAAYSATPVNGKKIMTTLYTSLSAVIQGVPRDRGGCANKMAVPTIANGRVYVGTQNELDVFGLLTAKNGPNLYLGNPCWTFPTSSVGTSVSQPLSLTNNGNATLTISNVTITGTNSADYSQTNTCTSLAPGAKCVITVTFTPSILGPESAFVMITDNANASGSPHDIFLVGAGK
jgi:hypothetical protein